MHVLLYILWLGLFLVYQSACHCTVNTHTDEPLALLLFTAFCLMLLNFIGALVTNRVLCLVPVVAWFEDWMFVRKFEMLNVSYVTVEVVGKYHTVYGN